MYVYVYVYMSNMTQRRDPAGLKLQRIKEVHKMIQSAGSKVDLVKLMAHCEYQMGITRRKVKEYLRTLEDLGYIEVNEIENYVQAVVKE